MRITVFILVLMVSLSWHYPLSAASQPAEVFKQSKRMILVSERHVVDGFVFGVGHGEPGDTTPAGRERAISKAHLIALGNLLEKSRPNQQGPTEQRAHIEGVQVVFTECEEGLCTVVVSAPAEKINSLFKRAPEFEDKEEEPF